MSGARIKGPHCPLGPGAHLGVGVGASPGFLSPGGIPAPQPEQDIGLDFLWESYFISPFKEAWAVERNFLGVGEPGVTFRARLHRCSSPSLSP